jgi:inhibitor of KinA
MEFMEHLLPYQLYALGDSAITIEWGNQIDSSVNDEVIARYHNLLLNPLPGMAECVPTYTSLTIYFNISLLKKKLLPYETVYDFIRKEINTWLQEPPKKSFIARRLISIPVCYEKEFAIDLSYAAAMKNMDEKELIRLHHTTIYRVYMIGFLPGFAYMGKVDDRIGLPRKLQPVNTLAGSVGIAGLQTGIYPFNSPGGWQIIGQTPLKIFDPLKKESCLLKAGDNVQLYPISKEEFYALKNNNY